MVIVDTAGRLGIDAEMMQQAADIRAAVDPQEVLFVVDAMVGQDAVNTAEAFRDGVGFTGVVLTKLDGDARGGAALSVREVTGQPIMFASNGEKLEDFDVFHPDRMASRILGMGDMLTLIEQAQKTLRRGRGREDGRQARGRQPVHPRGLPRPADGDPQDGPDRQPARHAARHGADEGRAWRRSTTRTSTARPRSSASMTPAERENPKMINGSRRLRIANGSGVKVNEVNQLVDRFFEARKMMGQMGGMDPRACASAVGDQVVEEQAQGREGQEAADAARRSRACPPASRAGSPAGCRADAGGLPRMPQLPPGMDELPDLTKLKLPKQ